jgi:hypothetical protein
MKFEEIQQPCESNDYCYSRKEYKVDFEWKEVDNTSIGDLPNDVFIYDFDKNLAVYQEKVVTVIEEERKFLDYIEIDALKESLRDKAKELATATVALVGALTLCVLSWDVCHPEKTVGELVYPDTWEGPSQVRETHYKNLCNEVADCIYKDAKANALVRKALEEGEGIEDLVEEVCTVHTIFGEVVSKDCKAMVDPIVDKANKRFQQ